MSVLDAARAGDEEAFAQLVAEYRRELLVHCYRMLGSLEDAEDALQETLVAGWRGLSGFQQRSSLRAWLYRIATNCCLRAASQRPPRMLSYDHGPARSPGDDLGEPVTGPVWLEPWPDHTAGTLAQHGDPAAVWDRRENVELAYVAALQHLPANQRAVLILREVLAFSAAEVADLLETSTASVNSALQRARRTVAERTTGPMQSDAGPDSERQRLVDAFVAAFERSDVSALVRLLAEDVRFTMPPLPAWFDGRDDVLAFFGTRVFATPWRTRPTSCNGQPALVGYQQVDGTFRLGALMVLSTRAGQISWIASFVDPDLLARLGLPAEL